MSKPSVFISSTIYDFEDLRSALKYWLGELGYDARLSEFNDFPKPFDKDSFSACLETIRNSDYYLLLIGRRVGALYDKENRISITRAEYREAYESFLKTGRPRIVTLVRTDVKTVLDERKDLTKYLQTQADQAGRPRSRLSTRKLVGSAPSRFVDDAAAIAAFVDEVGRQAEMRKAKTDSERPRGNWVHAFRTFEDVVDVLRQAFRVGSVRRSVLAANVSDALHQYVEALSERTRPGEKTSPRMPSFLRVAGLRKKVAELIQSQERWDEVFETDMDVEPKDAANAALFWIVGRSDLPTDALEECARSGEFHLWKPEAHRFVASKLQHAISRLQVEIELLRRHRIADLKIPDRAFEWRTETRPITLRVRDLAMIAQIHDRHANILALAAAIEGALDGDESLLDKVRLYEHGYGKKTQSLFAGDDDYLPVALLLSKLQLDTAEGVAAQTMQTPASSAPAARKPPDKGSLTGG